MPTDPEVGLNVKNEQPAARTVGETDSVLMVSASRANARAVTSAKTYQRCARWAAPGARAKSRDTIAERYHEEAKWALTSEPAPHCIQRSQRYQGN